MKKILAVAAAMFLGLSGARAGQPATQPAVANAAHLVVRIDASDAYLGVVRDFEANYLSNFRFDSILPQPPDVVDVEKSADGDAPLIEIFVDTHGSGNWAPQAADLVVSQLQSRVAMLVQQQRAVWKSTLDEAYVKNQWLEQKRIALEGRLKLVDGDLSDISAQTGLPDVSPRNLETLLQSMEAQYETVQIDTAGKSARRDALSNAVAMLAKQLHDRVDSDQIVEELEEVVKARQQEVDADKARYKEAISPALELNQAMAALAEAKAKVMERQEEVAHAAGGDQLQQWNQDLLLLSVDLADLHAQSDAIQKRLQDLGIARTQELKESTRDSLQSELDKIKEELDNLGSQGADHFLREPLPKLTVVESQ